MLPEPVYFLLVDDLEENLIALEALLQREHLVLLKARSGREALELLLEHDVALALLDVQMPEMDGFELAELMRGMDRTRTVPIIFLTAGSADQQRRFRGYEAGAVDFLQKPIEADILRSKAGVFFDLHRQRQESQHYAAALKEADRRKDEFLATLAHELRNPLAPIRNGLELMRMGADATTSAELRDMMDRQLRHMVRLIDDLLDMSRVSQGKIELRCEHAHIQEIIRSAVEVSRPLIESKHHQFTLDTTETPLWLNADITRIAQAISNLLNNAAKYTPERGHITLSLRQDHNQIVVAVKDNGVGLEKEMLKEVFELFTQVKSSLDHSQGGLGIGLALTKHLVEMHQGTISVDSPGLGQGCVFTLRLPMAMPVETAKPATKVENESPPATTSLRVLVVDDNIASAQTIGWMMEMIGHQPTLAHDGEEAISLAKSMQPDVILLDIGLPGKNGYEICRELRSDALFQSTMMIAQTGWGQKRDRDMAKEAGFDHHLIKPIDIEQLKRLLNQPNLSQPSDLRPAV